MSGVNILVIFLVTGCALLHRLVSREARITIDSFLLFFLNIGFRVALRFNEEESL